MFQPVINTNQRKEYTVCSAEYIAVSSLDSICTSSTYLSEFKGVEDIFPIREIQNV